jgi:hypothetical protein
MDYKIFIETDGGEALADQDCTVSFSDGTSEDGRTDHEGHIKFADKTPGVALWVDYLSEEGQTIRIDLYSPVADKTNKQEG